MSHEPTSAEYFAFISEFDDPPPSECARAMEAANRIRDARIRAEALEEAAAQFDGPEGGANWWIAKTIRALKDKTDDGEASR